jgi:hypothetical protein
MVHEITMDRVSEDIRPYFDNWESIFRDRMKDLSLEPLNWEGPDLNMRAFNSAAAYIDWFCCHPVIPEPCRDHSFYVRELTALSALINPSLVVEFGTQVGFGTFLLSKLNPDARLITVDIDKTTGFPDHVLRPTGLLPRMNHVDFTQIFGLSWETYVASPVDFCFIDADHTYDPVIKDSFWAWEHKNESSYVIAWHDYNPEDESVVGVVRAVNEFSGIVGIDIYRLTDSNTAWCYKKGEA